MKKILSRSIFIIVLLLPVIAFAHLLVFPQETKCILIVFADFKKQNNLYYRANVSANNIKKLDQLKNAAEKKALFFWDNNTKLDYKLIYCNNNIDYKIYGSEGSPAVTYLKLGSYVVIPKDMFDENILAHEISHTVLYRNLGWYILHFKIPTWFDEGLAMQVDEREYYSIDSLLKNKVSPLRLSEVLKMNTSEKFHNGSFQKVTENYLFSKYIIFKWLKNHSLNTFIKTLNDGESFKVAYGN